MPSAFRLVVDISVTILAIMTKVSALNLKKKWVLKSKVYEFDKLPIEKLRYTLVCRDMN